MDLSALMSLAKGKKTELAARSNWNNVVKPPVGDSKWRILPSWRPETPHIFFHDFGQHYVKDKDGNVKIVYVCDMDTFGRECAICDHINDAIRSTKDDDTMKLLKEMRSRQIQLVNAVRLDGADADAKKPVLLQLVGSLTQSYLQNLSTYQSDDEINILDADEGRAITITRQGSGLTTKYGLTVAGKSARVDPEALKRLVDIDAYIEGERVKGMQKGLSMLEGTTRGILALGGASTYVAPAAAKLMRPEPSRVIEAEIEVSEAEAEVEDEAPVKPAPKPAPKPAAKLAPAKAAKVADDAPIEDAELAAILAALDE